MYNVTTISKASPRISKHSPSKERNSRLNNALTACSNHATPSTPILRERCNESLHGTRKSKIFR